MQKKQRVLHVIDHTGSGGAQVVVQALLQGLESSFSCAVAVLGKVEVYSDVYRALGVPVFSLGADRSRWNPACVKALARLIQHENIDLVHTHLFKAHILGILAAQWQGCKVVVHDHSGIYPPVLSWYFSHSLLGWSYRQAYRYALKRCQKIIVPTPHEAQAYCTHYQVEPEKIRVVPNPLDLPAFWAEAEQAKQVPLRQELGLTQDTPLVMMVGRLIPQKDWNTFLCVAQRIQEVQQAQQSRLCGFVIVGAGPEEHRLRDSVRTRQLQNIFFLGARDDVPWLLPQAQVFLFTSQRESFGLAVLEAMAAGCLVVSTRCGGPESIIRHQHNGLLADVEDINGLARHVLDGLADQALHKRLVKHAQWSVETHYSLQSIATQMSAVYVEALS